MKSHSTLALAFLVSLVISCSKKASFSNEDPPGVLTSSTRSTAGLSTLVDSSVMVTTLAGNFTFMIGYQDGVGTSARFYGATDMVQDQLGNLYVTDVGNDKIRKVTPAGVVSTLALTNAPEAPEEGVNRIAIDNAGQLFYTGRSYYRILKVNDNGLVTTFAGGLESGYKDGPASQARFSTIGGMAFDGLGNLYVSDIDNHRIRKITPKGKVSTFAGSGEHALIDGSGTKAAFYNPLGIAVDKSNNLYVADFSKIRKITPDGVVTTLAGGDWPGDVDGQGSQASFEIPRDITLDAEGNLYVADGSAKVKKVTPQGVVTTLAGTKEGWEQVDGPGTTARFYDPTSIILSATSRTLYVADFNSVRKITF
jgi:sugar lactone lactonase YvrE